MNETQDSASESVVPKRTEANPQKMLSMIKIIFWGCLSGLLLAVYLWGKFRPQ